MSEQQINTKDDKSGASISKEHKKEKLQKAIDDGQDKKPKRKRRTRQEIKQQQIDDEKQMLRDDNYEIFQGIFKLLSDNDASKYGLEKVKESEFEPLARQYAMICNYYLPGGKPIYFVIASATFSSIAMMVARKKKIDEILAKRESENPNTATNQSNTGTGKVGFGQESLNQEQIIVKKI